MLEPQDRRQLLEALRPPPGYELDCAIGTTFTLDLIALLITPLAFTMFDMEQRDGEIAPDPLAWMEALRRYSGRIGIFCQAGQIGVPRHDQLLSFVESSVVEVVVPGGIFHPKMWALRYTSGDAPVIYRLLCLSRNLTFDRSWDTMLILEGELTERRSNIARNRPLGDFFAALPSLALRDLPENIRANVDRIQEELRRVEFEAPPSFTKIAFWPLGISSSRRWPFSREITRALVVSPFIGSGFLKKLAEGSKQNVLISRPESIDALGVDGTSLFDTVYVLSQNADPEEIDAATEITPEPDGESEGRTGRAPSMKSALSGLHAKLFVIESGRDVSIFTGSANATTAAFNRNVEFLVELVGEKRHHGVNVLLKQVEGETRLIDLLQRYEPPADPVPCGPEELLDRQLDAARITIASGGLSARVAPGGNADEFSMEIALADGASIALGDGISAYCRPITLQEPARHPLPLDDSQRALFPSVSFEALTTFVSVDLHISVEGCVRHCSFVLNIPVGGMPENRAQRLLISMLSDKARVLRFLLLLLADGRIDPAAFLGTSGEGRGKAMVFGSGIGPALFESLVKAFDRDPAKLDQIARVIDDLCKTDEGMELLPNGFMEIWAPVWQARQESLGMHSTTGSESAETDHSPSEIIELIPDRIATEDVDVLEGVPTESPSEESTIEDSGELSAESDPLADFIDIWPPEFFRTPKSNQE